MTQAGTQIEFDPIKRIKPDGTECPVAEGETFVLQFTGKQLPSGEPIMAKQIRMTKGEPSLSDSLFVPAVDVLTAAVLEALAEIEE